MKFITIIGARPQFIKAAPLSELLRQNHEEIFIHTGQHYDKKMSDIFFKDLNIPLPDYNLEVGSSRHSVQTGNMLIKLEPILEKEKPDAVIVYGDTNSTLAGSLCASKLGIELIHIEAGLRSFDKTMPEEINRIVSDQLSTILFAPTQTAVNNLKNEGINKNVYLVGDIMCDAALKYIKIAETKSDIISELSLQKNEYFLLTLHRASITNNTEIIKTIINIIEKTNKQFIFPIHPRTKNFLKSNDLWDTINTVKCLKIIEPVGYLDSLMLIKHAKKVLTDSGGIQKEAYILGTPCITIRKNTEWVETVETGWNFVTGYDKEKIEKAINEFEADEQHPDIFGDGNTAEKILRLLSDVRRQAY